MSNKIVKPLAIGVLAICSLLSGVVVADDKLQTAFSAYAEVDVWRTPLTSINQSQLSALRLAEQQLRQATQKGDSEAMYQLGKLLIYSRQVDSVNQGKRARRQKQGLFQWVLAADENNRKAIAALSDFVQQKMVDGKIPLRFSHYLSYVEQDWALTGKREQHHYAAYERWLALVERARLSPKQLEVKHIVAMAQDYENGYFLGADNDKAIKLYQIAAEKGDAMSQ